MHELMAEPARVFFVMAGLIGIALAVAAAHALDDIPAYVIKNGRAEEIHLYIGEMTDDGEWW